MSTTKSERVPPQGLRAIGIILIAFALLALYANVQKLRYDKIETLTVTPVVAPTPGSVP